MKLIYKTSTLNNSIKETTHSEVDIVFVTSELISQNKYFILSKTISMLGQDYFTLPSY